MNTPLCIGHRGAAGYEPENTLRSIATALQMGADAIEIDVHLTADGEVVVVHDADLKRTTGCDAQVCEMTLREIQRLDAGKGEMIPTLREVICFMAGKGMLNIELKGVGTALPVLCEIERAVLSLGVRHDDFLLSSFHWEELERAKDSCVQRGMLFSGWPDDLREVTASLRAYSVHPFFSEVTRERLAEAKEWGVKVFTWTVNTPADIAAVCHLGVDGLFTDYPDRVSCNLQTGLIGSGIENAATS